MAMAQINRPSIMVYGGASAQPSGDKLDVVGLRGVRAVAGEDITEEELKEVLRNACPGAGVRRHVHSQHHGVHIRRRYEPAL